MIIHGQCRCGAIGFELAWWPDPEVIRARACDCSFCTSHDGVWTATPAGELQVRIAVEESIVRHRFGTGTAEFLLCRTCGIAPVAVSEIDGRTYAVVNVTTFTDVDPATVACTPVSFGQESVAARLDRRRRNWIGHVAISRKPDPDFPAT